MYLRCLRLEPDGHNIVDTLDAVDISRSGLGAMVGVSYYPGQRVIVSLPLTESQGRRNIYATVVRCRREGSRSRIGLEFDSISLGSWCGVSSAVAVAA